MCNVYLHRVDRAWDTREFGVLVRFADDLLVLCKTRQQAQAALARLRALLADLGLAPKEAKTRIVELVVGGEGFDFLGFFITGWCARGGCAANAEWSSWPAGPVIGPFSGRGTASPNSRAGPGCCCRSRRW